MEDHKQPPATNELARKSSEESSPELNVASIDMNENDKQQEQQLQEKQSDVDDDFGEVDLDDVKVESEENKKQAEQDELKIVVAAEEQAQLPTFTTLRPPSPSTSSIDDQKKNDRRVTMAFRSTPSASASTSLNSSPALGTTENFSTPSRRSGDEESVRQLGVRDESHPTRIENLDLEPVSLDEHEDAKQTSTLRPNQNTSGQEQTSPSIGAKLGLTSAFGYAASLLPSTSTSPSKPIERGTSSPGENAANGQFISTGSSSSEDDSSSTPVPQDPVPIPSDAAKPPPAASGSWTSSFTNYFGSKSPSVSISSLASNPLPSIPSPFRKGTRPAPERTDTSGTAFLLHNLDATKEERRRSVEAGGSVALKEGFERVKRDSYSTRLREAAEYGDIGEDEEDEEDEHGQGLGVGGRRRSSVRPHTATKSQAPAQPPPKPTDYSDDQEPELGPDGVDWPFWGCVMNDYEAIARSRPRDLSRAIQQGIPAVVRGTIWQLMSSSKNPGLEATYAGLLKEKSTHERAIQKDLARTLPGHRYFAQGGGVGQENLFNVVKAYSLYDVEVGYTQGVAFIVAALLLNMPDEEAFCVLVRLMESYNLRTHYLPEMPGLQLRMFQFERLLEELLPLLHLHFVRKGVKSSMYASTWFLTLFTHRFPLSLVYRIFDIVFAEGIEAIFRFSLALMRRNEDKLLALDFEGILKFLGNEVFDCYKTTTAAESGVSGQEDESDWLANDFVRDAYATQITPFMLDSYAHEWEDLCRIANAHATEMDTLRSANRVLSAQVKQLEGAMAAMSEEHVDMVKQLVQARIDNEATESELIRYKTMYAELVHEQDSNRASYIAPPSKSKQSNTSSIHRTTSNGSFLSQNTSTMSTTTTAMFHLTLMREALSYSYLCEVSPTAFSVGAVIFLPRSASVPLFDLLSGVFAPVDREGLILSNGYSRQIPGNTHAEANAINNLVAYLKNLPEDTNSAIKKTTGIAMDASSEETARSILSKAWIYTTLEPCSKRTSGLKDCTAEVIHWGLKRVYMGVREPPDYVQCEGVRLLREAGVEVISVQGMEEECLAAARRGL